MDEIIISPSKYIQGENVLVNIAEYVKPLGKKALIIADEFVTGLVGPTLDESFTNSELPLHAEVFKGECSRNSIMRRR